MVLTVCRSDRGRYVNADVMAIVLNEPEADATKNVVRFQSGKVVFGSPG
jgi:hypothetical protein